MLSYSCCLMCNRIKGTRNLSTYETLETQMNGMLRLLVQNLPAQKSTNLSINQMRLGTETVVLDIDYTKFKVF